MYPVSVWCQQLLLEIQLLVFQHTRKLRSKSSRKQGSRIAFFSPKQTDRLFRSSLFVSGTKPIVKKNFVKWILGIGLVAVMLWWNWKLWLATFVGIVLMLSVYFLQQQQGQVYLSQLKTWLAGDGGKLSFAVGSGGVAALITYLAANIWTESDRSWLAGGIIAQGFVTLITMLVLIGQNFSDRHFKYERQWEQLLTDLSHSATLKRLVAVRQIFNRLENNRCSATECQQVREYFLLVLASESELVVRNAILECFASKKIGELDRNCDRLVKIPLNLTKYEQEIAAESDRST